MIGKINLRNNVNKGISLPIDTTIIIILAVVVLAVLLAMFFSVAGPGGGDTSARLKQVQICGAYRSADNNCDGKEYNNYIKDSNNEKILKELGEACRTLKISGCSGAATFSCIQACCTGCESNRDKCTNLGGRCTGGCSSDFRIPEGDVSCTDNNLKCCKPI